MHLQPVALGVMPHGAEVWIKATVRRDPGHEGFADLVIDRRTSLSYYRSFRPTLDVYIEESHDGDNGTPDGLGAPGVLAADLQRGADEHQQGPGTPAASQE